jgi:hypothetical protein
MSSTIRRLVSEVFANICELKICHAAERLAKNENRPEPYTDANVLLLSPILPRLFEMSSTPPCEACDRKNDSLARLPKICKYLLYGP